MTHEELKNHIRLALGRRPDLRIWNNPCGVGWAGEVVSRRGGYVTLDSPRIIHYGVANPGGADLIGIRAVTVTPEMVGQTIGVFVGLEVKTGTGRMQTGQKSFREIVIKLGGHHRQCRAVEDAVL